MNNLRLMVFAFFAAAAAAAAVEPGGEGPAQAQPASQVRVPPELRQRIRIDDAALRRHVIRPQHILGIESDVPAVEPDAPPRAAAAGRRAESRSRIPGLRPVTGPRMDAASFARALHAKLRPSAAGYVMRLQRYGTPVATMQWEWARRPADGSIGWTPDRRMHIASVSKLITAIGMAKALDERNLSYDAKIIDYLPKYWKKGPNVESITFRHLLRHRSGFSTGGSGSDFALMKSKVADGVTDIGKGDYENMNFGLCRILIPFVLYGDFLNAFSFSDEVWDYITITAYTEFMQTRVFTPSGVTGATLSHPPNGALAYTFPASGSGWNSGDLSTMSGGAGWHMSANELLRVLATFRHKGTILAKDEAQALFDAKLGLDQIHETPAGPIYNKNGRWTTGSKTEQSVAFILPDGMELVVFVNSRIAGGPGGKDQSLRDLVRETYLAHLK